MSSATLQNSSSDDFYGRQLLEAISGYIDLSMVTQYEMEIIADRIIDNPRSDAEFHKRASEAGLPIFSRLYNKYGDQLKEKLNYPINLTESDMIAFLVKVDDNGEMSVDQLIELLRSYFTKETIQTNLVNIYWPFRSTVKQFNEKGYNMN